MRRTFKIILPLTVILVAVVVASYMRATKPYVEPQPARERVWPVAVVEAAPKPETPHFQGYGMVVAGRALDLRPQVAGRVIDIAAELIDGGVVRSRQHLVTIDPFDFEIAVEQRSAEIAEVQAKLAEVESDHTAEQEMLERDLEQVAITERDVQRRTTLREKAAGSEKALDDARMTLSEHREATLARRQTVERLAARAAQLKAEISRLEAALRRDRRDLERAQITAPFDAFVDEVDVAVGKQVSTGDRLARLVDATWLDVRFHLSSGEFARLVASGDYRSRPVEVSWTLGTETRNFTATIERQSSSIDAATGGVDMYARIADTDASTLLRPGAFVVVRIPDRTHPAVVRLPREAVHGGNTVYTVEDGRLALLTVTPVGQWEGSVLVADLDPGTIVVTTRLPGMGPGLRVAAQ